MINTYLAYLTAKKELKFTISIIPLYNIKLITYEHTTFFVMFSQNAEKHQNREVKFLIDKLYVWYGTYAVRVYEKVNIANRGILTVGICVKT